MDTQRTGFDPGSTADRAAAASTEELPVDSSYFDTEPTPAPPPPQRAEGGGCGLHLLRIAIGAAIAFVVMSLLYGPNMAMMAIAFAVVCTAGVSLILILPGCWLVGWVAIAAWEAISREFAKPPAPGAP